ncbi:MAG: hypothetical protein K9J42_03150 [Sulfuritalea sp.]|nr:hypothetical protein [Sulfuritalea sp.]
MPDMWSKILWIYGLAVAVSMLIAVLIKLIVIILGRLERVPTRQPEPAAPAVTANNPAADHVVAISAAVYAVLGSHRIVHIEETRRRGGWLAEGRHAQHTSHGVGHHPRHKSAG